GHILHGLMVLRNWRGKSSRSERNSPAYFAEQACPTLERRYRLMLGCIRIRDVNSATSERIFVSSIQYSRKDGEKTESTCSREDSPANGSRRTSIVLSEERKKGFGRTMISFGTMLRSME